MPPAESDPRPKRAAVELAQPYGFRIRHQYGKNTDRRRAVSLSRPRSAPLIRGRACSGCRGPGFGRGCDAGLPRVHPLQPSHRTRGHPRHLLADDIKIVRRAMDYSARQRHPCHHGHPRRCDNQGDTHADASGTHARLQPATPDRRRPSARIGTDPGVDQGRSDWDVPQRLSARGRLLSPGTARGPALHTGTRGRRHHCRCGQGGAHVIWAVRGRSHRGRPQLG